MTKTEIASDVRRLVLDKWPELERLKGGCCFYMTLAGLFVLRNEGYDPLIQAGNMSWPIVKPENDDGVSPTHFSFMWSPNELASQLAVIEGRMPEFHAWIALRPTTIIDFSTSYLPEVCKETIGLPWGTERPPDFLWTDDLPAGVYYEALPDATRFVMMKVQQIMESMR